MISAFRGEHRWLSNFWPAVVHLDGRAYPTVEHAYQAAKTPLLVERERIAACATPGQAKRAGRILTGWKLRPDWKQVRVNVMRELLWQKFSDHPELRVRLIATGDEELREGNGWGDAFWGVDERTGVGLNMLGKLLIEIRDQLR